MINWRNVWLGVVLGSCVVVLAACNGYSFQPVHTFGMTSEPRAEKPNTWNCYIDGEMLDIPPGMEVVRCQPHYPRNSDGKRHLFCHLKETS